MQGRAHLTAVSLPRRVPSFARLRGARLVGIYQKMGTSSLALALVHGTGAHIRRIERPYRELLWGCCPNRRPEASLGGLPALGGGAVMQIPPLAGCSAAL